MYKNLNSWTLGISGRQSELIELALTYGFRGIDIDIQDMIGRSESKGVEHATRFLLSAQKLLRIGGFDLPVVWTEDEATYKADLAKLPQVAEMAAMVGAQGCVTTVVAASANLPYQENFELHRERLAEMAGILAQHDIRLGLAFESAPSHREGKEYEFVFQVEPLLTLIKTVSAENVGILLDSWHWHVGGGGADQLTELDPEQIVAVRLADIPDDVNLTTIDDSQRVAPGDGGLVDCAAIVRALAGIGYEGPVSLFPYPSRFRNRTRDKTVQRATAALDSIWEAAGLSRFGRAEESTSTEDGTSEAVAGEGAATPAGDAATEENAATTGSE
ncbi:MAG: xylose isomerase [Planctomycetaceae bacterium]|nr:xylose isomerase [Planctomycetaceae bacterium]